MAVMMAKLYDALKAANVPNDVAVAAAEEAAEISDVKSSLTLLKWMVGFNLGVSVAIIGKLLLMS